MQRIAQLITVLFILCALPATAAELAGEVRSVVGEANIVDTAGAQRTAAQGMKLHVGDTLKTGKGGHMHLRMVDDALLSLRPDSELKITGYTYRVGAPDQTSIRFDLLRGTARSVTGKGGELAKDKFRMNTPVAAIGVRGTDFVAQSDAETTLVHVQAGAIVLAPLGEGCQTSSLGPCQTASARTLTAEMQDMMLKFIRGTAEPKLVPLKDELKVMPAPVASGNAVRPQLQAQSSGNASGEVPLDSAWQVQSLDSLAVQQPPIHYQMVWGRWSEVSAGNDLGLAFSEAAQGREVTVGNTTVGLFRDNTGPMALPVSGRTEFTLRAAQVTLGGAIAGQVQNGSLGVDFDMRTFDTQLGIQHPALANPATLNASGVLRSDGMLYSLAMLSNGTVAGSLSRDGAEAGYQFKLPTAAGNLTGTTLWVK